LVTGAVAAVEIMAAVVEATTAAEAAMTTVVVEMTTAVTMAGEAGEVAETTTVVEVVGAITVGDPITDTTITPGATARSTQDHGGHNRPGGIGFSRTNRVCQQIISFPDNLVVYPKTGLNLLVWF
jgi:hypothetical protein